MRENRKQALEDEAMEGANAATEYKILQAAFFEKRADIMQMFESSNTLDTEALQNAHRTYKNLCDLEEFFLIRIKRGQEAQNRLTKQ